MASRIEVRKTYKLYVGGAFVRSESGRVYPVAGADGSTVRVAQASRMDLSTGEVDAFDPLVRPWRTNVRGQSGLGADARNAFRFLLILDRTLGQTVEIQSLKVIINV